MKKNIIVYLTTFLISVLLFAGCSKKEDPKPITNGFTLSGKTYDTPKASVAKALYMNTFSGAFMVAINANSLDFKIEEGTFYYSNGNNPVSYNYLLFYLRPSVNATSLTSGTYNVNTSSISMACYGGSVTINDNPNNSIPGINMIVLTGSVIVNKIDETNYQFDYNFVMKDNSTLKGNYKGFVATGSYNFVPTTE